MKTRPAWWPDDFSPEQVAAAAVGKDAETAMYLILAADCDLLVRQMERESWDAPSGTNPHRIQVFVTKNKVTNAIVG